MAKKRTGSTGLTRGMIDAGRQTLEQASKATGKKTPTKAGKYYRKSYLLTMDLITDVKQMAEEQGVGINEFVRWALDYVIQGIKEGAIKIPIEEQVKRRIKF